MAQEMGLPAELAKKGLDIEFHHIGLTMEPILHTAGFKSYPTTTIHDCPKLDYLLIGGPCPHYLMNIPESVLAFIRTRIEEVQTLFTTCSGGMVAAAAGVLNGKKATTNHGFIPMAMKTMPQVKWDKKKQWVIDGKFWTAGGACAGMDMFAHWVTERCGREVAEAGYLSLDYEPRDVDGNQVQLRKHLHN